MKNNLFLATVLIFSCVLTPSARAATQPSTDYQCLHTCIGNGKPESTCMPQCSYDPTTQAALTGITPNATPPNHRLLAPLVPGDNQKVEITTPPPNPYTKSTDYHCLSQCLQNRLQYATCELGCTTVKLKSGEPDPAQLLATNHTAYSELLTPKPASNATSQKPITP